MLAGGLKGGAPCDEPSSSGVAAAKQRPRRWKRWRRYLLLLCCALIAASYFGRIRILQTAIETWGPGFIEDQVGAPAVLVGVRVRESDVAGAGLVVEIDRMEARSDGALRLLRAEGVRVVLTGWNAWQAADPVIRMEIDGVEVVRGSAQPTGGTAIDLPELPASPPALPFPLTVSRVEYRADQIQARGEVMLTPERWTARADLSASGRSSTLAIEGPPSALGFTTVYPSLGLRTRGTVARRGTAWTLSAGVVRNGHFIATLMASVPDAGDPVLTVSAAVHDARALAGLVPGPVLQRLLPLDGNARVLLRDGRMLTVAKLRTAVGPVGAHVSLDRATLAGGIEASQLALGKLSAAEVAGDPVALAASARVLVAGPLGSPHVIGEVAARRSGVFLGGERLPIEALRLRLSSSGPGSAQLEGHSSLFGGQLGIRGQVPLTAPGRWELYAWGHGIDVQSVRHRWPGLRDVAGTVSGLARVGGVRDDPSLLLLGRLSEGQVAPEGWERVRDIEARVMATQDWVALEEITARVGGGGVSGRASLMASEPFQFDARVELDGVLLHRSPGMLLRGSGALRVHGSTREPHLGGQLEIDRGLYRRNYYPSLAPQGSQPFDLFAFDEGVASRLRFDLEVRLNRGFLIRNNRLRAAPAGSLRLTGTGQQPVLTGRLDLHGATARLPHVSLELSEAEVEWPKDDPFRPRIRFVGDGRIRNWEITARGEGELFDAQVAFSSVPTLPQADLVSLVGTGYLADELRDRGAGSTAALEVAKLYGPEVWEQLFGQSSGESVFDRVEITTVEAAGDDEVDQYRAEVRVLDWLGVSAERDNSGDVNFDVLLFHWLP